METQTLPVPFLSHLEPRPTFRKRNFTFEVLVMTILRERKEAGHGVKTFRIAGEYWKCSSELASEHGEVRGCTDARLNLGLRLNGNTAVDPFMRGGQVIICIL